MSQEAEPLTVTVVDEPEIVPVLGSVDDYLRFCMQYDASDLHLATASAPIWRRYGNLQAIWDTDTHRALPLTPEDSERLAHAFLSPAQIEQLETRGDVDFAYSPDFGRFRASVVKQRLGIDMAFRIISSHIRSVSELGLPETVRTLCRYHNGIILVTGPVGCGKSTTLAALIDAINEERQDHIITLEDPIEYVFEPKSCHVNQREVHTHTKSFATALRGALREDPDVIMVGEMRDLETISLAITAAETGHLVLGTLHTGNAPRTLDRVLDVFPSDQREQIRVMVSESLRGIISQQLVPRADGQGRVMALEVLVNTPAVAANIRDGKTFMLPGVMQTGKNVGMILMDDSLRTLYTQGLITREEAESRADDKTQMKRYFES
jgi:twitching motility protein PilT